MTTHSAARASCLMAFLLVLVCGLANFPAFGQASKPVQWIPIEPLTSFTGLGYLQAIATNSCVGENDCTNSSHVWITNISTAQVNGETALTFTIAGGSNGFPYDVFASTTLTRPITNSVWTWMGQGYQGVTYTMPAFTEARLYLLLGTPQDSDGDGLTDAYELLVSHSNPNVSNSINPSELDYWAVLQNLNPFAVYDQQTFPTAPQTRLGYWQFNGSYEGQGGQLPVSLADAPLVPDWSGEAVSMNNQTAGELSYNVFETNGLTNLSCANGTIRFWFQPNWSTGGSNTPWTGSSFFNAGSDNNHFWRLSISDYGTNTASLIQFFSASNEFRQTWAFKTLSTNGITVNFRSNMWYQIVMTYSPTNIALYTNGVLLATGNWAPNDNGSAYIFTTGDGMSYYPPASSLTSGFSFGCVVEGSSVLGQLDELETFNYPLSPQAVAAGFPTFAGAPYDIMADSDYDGRSDILEVLVDGTDPQNPSSVTPCRLGFWRFDASNLMAEQGQLPKSYNDVSLTPSWSGTALDINSDPASQVTYWDVFTNGWANINCRQGCLRFWFKPNWNGHPPAAAPFVYLGNTNSALSQWALSVTPGGAIAFSTTSNGVAKTLLTSPPLAFSSGNWMQITLNYGPNGTSIYTNGMLAATGNPVTQWPPLSDRNLGMVIGNNTACNNSINGQFDEIETFNYQLAPSTILSNFQVVQAVDSNLDGVPDWLEDIVLPVSRPFLGAPVVITGTLEAEQFDMGGPGVGYYSLGGNAASSYRPTGLFITNCNDIGLGYCLDRTRAGEWAQYTINVLAAQTYTIEARAAGIGSNGVFECEFTGNGFYTNTGPLTITTTNWTNVSGVVFLTNGIYTMRLHCLTNGSDGQHVGKFNYISIYPWWQTGFASLVTNTVTGLSTNNDWADATNNAGAIQQAINTLPPSGGTVLLPAGNYYVSQASPNEARSAFANAAVSIMSNNIEIVGTGQTNTTLIAYNRATTVFCLGEDTENGFRAAQCSNCTIRDLTIQAQPHLAVFNVTNTTSEVGQLLPGGGNYTGALTCFYGLDPSHFARNVLFTNCQFLYGDFSITIVGAVSNFFVTHCDFNVWGGTNIYTGTTNNYLTNNPDTTTYNGSVGIFCSGSPSYNITILENTFNGNTNLFPSTNNSFGYVNTVEFEYLAPDGFVYFQSGGNFFIARNTILNNALEGIQLDAGPSSVVGNTFNTLVNDGSCCALAALNGGFQGLTGSDPINYSTCFIGNQVYGGRNGESPQGTHGLPYVINFSGNELNLYPPFVQGGDYPGSAAVLQDCTSASILGNTLGYGGHGVTFGVNCSNALIMNNNFSNVTYRGIGLTAGGGSLQRALLINNILGEGVSFHVQLPFPNSFGWFLYQNEFLNSSNNSVPPFLDPISSAVHISD